jgi:N utilization substance protein B
LAREWALKILYQIDIGRVSPTEAFEGAMETLRREFVQRGSRSASGSPAEAFWLDYVTGTLRDTLPTLRLPMERALTTSAARLCEEAPYWQELLLEKAFKRQTPPLALVPAHLLEPLPEAAFFPPEESAEGMTAPLTLLTPEETARYTRFVREAREQLPEWIEKTFWNETRALAKTVAQERPLGSEAQVQTYLLAQRETYNRDNVALWRKVGATAQKQTGEWLRTAAFVLKLAQGALAHRIEIDAEIEALAAGWRLERQAAVDRNILRMAGFEMLFLPGIPTAASINEAVELAKKYSTAESGRFVNGVLGAFASKVGDKLTPPALAQDAIESAEKDDVLDLPDITSVEEIV